MRQVKSYYDLLGVTPQTDSDTILAIINRLREKDHHHSYCKMLDNLERTLINKDNRKEYDRFLIQQKRAINRGHQQQVSNQQRTHKSHIAKSTAAIQPTTQQTKYRRKSVNKTKQRQVNHQLSLQTSHLSTPASSVQTTSQPNKQNAIPNATISHQSRQKVVNSNQTQRQGPDHQSQSSSNKKMRSSVSDGTKNHYLVSALFDLQVYIRAFSIVLILLALSSITWLGHKAYTRWLIHQQTTEAVESLRQSSKDIEDYIRLNHYFPEQLTTTATSPYYSLQLDDKNIILTFSEQSADTLPNTQLLMLSRNVPRIGLEWQCKPAENFPNEYLPRKCY